MKRLHKLTYLLPLLLLVGCTPDYVKVDLYTSDLQDAFLGKLIEVPAEMEFSGHLGDDADNNVQQVIQLSKKFLGKSAEYTRSKGQFGEEVIVVKVQIPMGTEAQLTAHLKKAENKNIPLVLIADPVNRSVSLLTLDPMENFNRQMLAINFMLQMKMVPTVLTYNIVSDEKVVYKVSGQSVFVNGKPFLFFEKNLKRRESVALDYSGQDGSIWKTEDLRPMVHIHKVMSKTD